MPTRHRTRRRIINGSCPRYMAAIALALAVLIPLKIASATMAKLLRPAHYHVSLHVGYDDAGSDALTPSFGALVDNVQPIMSVTPAQPSSGTQYGDAHGRDHGHSHSLSHTGAHSRTHAHNFLQRQDHGHADSPAHRDVSELTASRHSETVAHAHTHAAGVGHHRHASGDADVVYVDDAPQSPAQTSTRLADITVMLLPVHLWVSGRAAATSAPPGPPPAPLVVQYSLPGERPPS